MLKLGRRANSKFVRLHVLEGNGCLGIAVSRAVGSHARRNQARRRVREAWHQSTVPDGWDVVLMVKTSVDQASFHDLVEDLAKAKAQAVLLMNSQAQPPTDSDGTEATS